MAIALDTKGPEIRTGFLEGDDGRLELTLEKGASIKITTDDAFKEKCTKETLWVDYKNIPKVLTPGKRIFIDDGLISVVAKEMGPDYVIGEIENGGNLGSKKGKQKYIHGGVSYGFSGLHSRPENLKKSRQKNS